MASTSNSSTMSIHNFSAAAACKRKEKDIMKLMLSDYKVVRSENDPNDFIVEFIGPKESLYQGGTWMVHVVLPDAYPYKSPSIGFSNRIYHPNIDEMSGTVCLDVINQTWSPMFDLINIFDIFLPQLLMYPNPTSPLNPEAASLMVKDPSKYECKIKEYVLKFAQGFSTNTNSNGNASIKMDIEAKKEKSECAMNIEKEAHDEELEFHEDDKISLGEVSELSETSDIEIIE